MHEREKDEGPVRERKDERENALSIFVGHLDGKLFFNGHNNFDSVKRVKSEVLGEAGVWCNLRDARQPASAVTLIQDFRLSCITFSGVTFSKVLSTSSTRSWI